MPDLPSICRCDGLCRLDRFPFTRLGHGRPVHGLDAIVNLVAIFMLGKYAIAALRDYNAQKRRGILDPVFDPRILPDKKGVQCWPRDEDRRRKAN